MSQYLVTEIGKTANIDVRPWTEVVDGGGRGSLETLTLRDSASGTADVVPAAALFVMIGAEPHTQWLQGSVERDEGDVLTGRDLYRAGDPACWPFERPPLLLETSMPGVFVAGDVLYRHRSVKRVASAAGEGAIAIHLLHEYLRAGTDDYG